MNELDKIELESNNQGSDNFKPKTITPWIITILIAAWLIAMGILGAGYLIAQEVAKNRIVNSFPAGTEQANSPGTNNPAEISITDSMQVLGQDSAPVTMIEFADYQCPYCGHFQSETFAQLKSNYIDTGKVKFVYVDFPFLGEESIMAAEAAHCAADQNKFWEYHDKLYQNQNGENEGVFTADSLKKYAGELGLNTADFSSCVEARLNKPVVEENIGLVNQLSVNSTPTFFINGYRFEGSLPYESFAQIIDAQL